tara:strand:- start:127 stop:819 length:693 start_codon:yes stop_codon:yes gene_type:complete
MEAINLKSYVLVTGGSGGIGSAVCRLCPSYDLTPIIGFNNNATSAKVIAKETKGFAVRIDMSDNNSIMKAVEFIRGKIESSGSLTAVVLGASPPPALEPFLKISSKQLSHQMNVNLIGPNLLLQNLVRHFFRKNKSGTIVGVLTEAIGSEDRPPSTGMGSYIIAKTALKGLLSVCSAEYPWLKMRTVSPGFTKTPMLDVFDKRYLEIANAKTPIAEPEDVANLIINKIVL